MANPASHRQEGYIYIYINLLKYFLQFFPAMLSKREGKEKVKKA